MTQPARVRLVLFVLALGAFAYFYQAGGWNQNVRFDLVRAVVEDHTLVIDRFARNTGDLARRNDHHYCDKAPGVSFLGVPAYAAVHATQGPPTTPDALAGATWITTVIAIAIPSAIAVAFFAGLAGALTIRSGPAAALAVAWAIGTLAWPYSTVFYGHQLVAALLVVAFALLVPIRRRKVEATALRVVAVGFLLAGAVVVEYPAALASIVIGLYALSVLPARRYPLLIAGAIVPGLALAAYHAAAFGGPLTLPYEFSTQPHRHMGFFMGLGAPDPAALWSILFSDYRGLFYASPWLLLALPGSVRLGFRGFGREVAVCVAIVVLFIWLNASLVDWQGGWAMGPRYLVPAIPFLALLAGGVILPSAQPAAPSVRRGAWIAAAAFVGYSVFLMLVGTAVKPEVPSHIKRPYQQYLLPRFYRGEIAVSTQSFDMSGHPDSGPRHATNLGKRIGLDGGASLVPLAAWLLAWLGVLIAVSRTRSTAPPVSAASPPEPDDDDRTQRARSTPAPGRCYTREGGPVSEHGRILILWNQVEDDVYERWRAEGRNSVDWDPNRVVHDVGTVAEDMQQIVTALKDAGHEVSLVNIRDEFATLVAAIQQHKPDAILNLVEFFGDDASHEAHVAGVLELMGVAYTGARPFALTLCQRKHRAKAMLREAGLPTSPYFVVSGRIGDDHAPQSHGLRFPLIVKPAFEDASGGIELTSVVRDQAALEERVDYTLEEYAMPVLVEEYIDGREIHCAVIGNDPPEPLPLFEMEFTERLGSDGKPLPKIITFRAKWDPYHRDFYAMDGRCPAEGLEPEVEAHIKDVAIRAYRALGCRDYARVDMRLDAATGQPYILEVNPNPDLADGGAFIQCATASGRTFAATINQIIGFALTRARAHAEHDVDHEERGENGPRGASDQLLSEHMNRNKPNT